MRMFVRTFNELKQEFYMKYDIRTIDDLLNKTTWGSVDKLLEIKKENNFS